MGTTGSNEKGGIRMSGHRKYDSNGNRPGTRRYNGRILTGGTNLTRLAGCPLPDHYRGTGPTRIGFGRGIHGTPSVSGILQIPLQRHDLDECTLEKSGLVLGKNKRLYESRRGLIDCMAEVKATGTAGQVYVDKVDWKSFPPMGELAFLFDKFFSKFDREVLMIVGWKRDGTGWMYHVPRQEGSSGLVTWSSTESEMAWFSKHSKWIGTLHVHPGTDCTPSQTDVDDWAEPCKSGLHVIFGRQQGYTINGSIAARTFQVESGTLSTTKRIPVGWTTSGRRPLMEILLQPPPVKIFQRNRLHGSDRYRSPGSVVKYVPTTSSHSDFVDWVLAQTGILRVEKDQIESLRLVSHNGSYYLVTLDKWSEVQKEFKPRNEGTLPVARRLSIYTVRGDKI